MKTIQLIARTLLLFLPVLVLMGTTSSLHFQQARPGYVPLDSVDKAPYIAGKIAFKDKYSFLDYDNNYLQWQNVKAISGFFDKLKKAKSRKVTVVHIGDSHVQADIGTGHVRNLLQSTFGAGGRGLIFPYACARTHPAVDYQTYSYGRWTCARNVNLSPSLPLGTMGVSARTDDPTAVFKIVFNRYYNDVNSTLLKVYCELGDETFDLKLKYGPNPEDTTIIRTDNYGQPFVATYLPKSPGMLEFSIKKTKDSQTYFQIYGISLETPATSGILYHSVGINGASFGHVLQQERMDAELAVMNPDLVVIDLSGNEFYMGLNEATYKEKLTNLVQRLRKGSPQASILITCSQDIYRYYTYNLAEAEKAAQLSMEVAYENDCAFYDYYRVSGGRYSMLKWRAHNLAKTDRVHLTYEGYLLKGELFANALLTSYHQYLQGYMQTPFADETLPKPSFQNAMKLEPYTPVPTGGLPPTAAPAGTTTAAATPPPGTTAQYYTVRQGDVLGTIAERYGVSVYQLRVWNGVYGNLIQVGQRLVIYTAKPVVNTAPATQTAKPTPAPATGGTPTYYTVKSGDTLYGIALQYKTTVNNIMRLSGLSNSNLKPGQRLRVK